MMVRLIEKLFKCTVRTNSKAFLSEILGEISVRRKEKLRTNVGFITTVGNQTI